jgi:hypothetical protein
MDENFVNLIECIKSSNYSQDEKEHLIHDVKRGLNSFVDYFNQVVKMEIFASTTITWTSTTEYMYKTMDEKRRMLHNICINACKNLNDICENLGIQSVCNINIEDRHEVAAFCGYIVTSVFMDGIEENQDNLLRM